jgi:hypothetical protein
MVTAGDEQRSWLTRLLAGDPGVLRRAAELVGQLGGGDDAYLAVRRMLDDHLREVTGWPRAADYGVAAHELGDSEHARLLWKIAGTGRLLAEAGRRWEQRYAGRGVTKRERIAGQLCAAEEIDYDPDGPVRGIDGAWYAPGFVEDHAARGWRSGFVVVVYSATMAELVTGFTGYEAQRRWVADRGPTAVGQLTTPEVGGAPTPRLVGEELILARLLAVPGELADLSRSLRPDSFTADGRYLIYAAITAQASAGARWYADEVAEELARRVAWLPGRVQQGFGGSGAPWLQAYLRRLDQTPAGAVQAARAVQGLSLEDQRARQRREHMTSGPLRTIPGQVPDTTASPGPAAAPVIPLPRQRPPGPGSGPGPGGPVPRL